VGAVTVGSKWGYTYTADWRIEADRHEVKDHTLPVLRRQYGESVGLLGPHLALYQIHSATLDSGVMQIREVLDELGRLRDDGLAIGLSLSGPGQAETLRKALDVTIGGRPLFGCVQATWNLLEPSAGAALREAHERGLGVVIKEALANGRLTTRNTDPAFAASRLVLEKTAARLVTTVDALALAAVLAQPWVDVVLSGAARIDHLTANLAALAVPLDADTSQYLATLAEEPHVYWQTRSRLPWN
jgi:aryl-alcohol dehydrogenase-like predicted oxidoreductase